MTESQWKCYLSSERETRLLAQLLACRLGAGDVLALSGDLGAGKSTLARELIRSLMGDPTHEVPSPTYSLLQVYDTPHHLLRHYDFYRLGGPDEVRELDFEDDLDAALTIIEWPDRAEGLLPDHTLRINLSESDEDEADGTRIADILATGSMADRVTRMSEMWDFITTWATARALKADDIDLSPLQGDASARSYSYLRKPQQSWLLMDSPRQPDGPPIRDGLPYSKIAHLAEEICPFIAIADELRKAGFSAPVIDRVDRGRGLAVVEDLGRNGFGDVIDAGGDAQALYGAAVDVLVALRKHPNPSHASALGCNHTIPQFDARALQIEVSLLLDWYAPHVLGQSVSQTTAGSFQNAWQEQFIALSGEDTGWVLRDYHSPNLIWLPERTGLARVGLIDFQDAVVGHPAYDLVSLLQDARRDVPAALEKDLLAHYSASVKASDSTFDEEQFVWAYALMGAQRNTKILGIFTRLAVRDGKAQYLRHIPRISRYLCRNLQHPRLRQLKEWFEAELPHAIAGQELPG